MSLDDPVILTCAISGAVADRDQCPAIPYRPEEYAAEARRIVDEGGSMIHIHARTPEGVPSYEVEDFRAITEAIRAEPAAWEWFEMCPPGYRRTATHWVVSAKRPETRERRLAQLIEDSAAGVDIKPLRRA